MAGETPQEFASPGYPLGYANGLECEWRIRSVPGTRVMFNITDINLESHSSCNFDTVTVTERNDYYEGLFTHSEKHTDNKSFFLELHGKKSKCSHSPHNGPIFTEPVCALIQCNISGDIGYGLNFVTCE